MISPTMPGGRASRSASVGARGLGLVVLMGYREGSTRSCAAADRRGTLGADGQPARDRAAQLLERGAGAEAPRDAVFARSRFRFPFWCAAKPAPRGYGNGKRESASDPVNSRAAAARTPMRDQPSARSPRTSHDGM